MQAYEWPGNIRELQNCVERAAIVARGSMVDITDLPSYIFDARPRLLAPSAASDLDAELARLERQMIMDALHASGGVQARAAERLGITQRSFWYRVKRLDIRIGRLVE
jgi:DNA-binding NtrC family response regulator